MKPSERMQQLYAEELNRAVTAHDGEGLPRYRIEAELREQLHIVAITRYLDEQHELRQHASDGAIAAAEQARASDTERPPLAVVSGKPLPNVKHISTQEEADSLGLGATFRRISSEAPLLFAPAVEAEPCNCDQAQRLEQDNARLTALLDRARELLWVADYRDSDRDRQRLALLRELRTKLEQEPKA